MPYTLSLALTLDVGANVTVESPSHRIRVAQDGLKKRVELTGEPLDRDFILLVAQTDAEDAVSVVCHRDSEKEGYFALTIIPDLFDAKESALRSSVVFVLDRSGSMGGEPMTEARTALRLCLRQLREGDVFNILAFDTTVERFAPKPVPFTARTLADADAFIDAVDARGGTELLAPMEEAVTSVPEGIVILLTDGQVGNEAEILARVNARRGNARIYSFGIGTNVSTALLSDFARTSGGAFEGIYPGERIDQKVVAQFSRATAARITEVSVTLEGVDAAELAPSAPRSLVDGEPWCLFGAYETSAVGRATIRGKKAGDSYALTIPLALEARADAPFVRRLWAKERVRELEDVSLDGRRAASNKARIVDLCVANGIVSKYASFIVVEKREGDRRTSTPAETKVVPVNLPAGWDMPRAASAVFGAAALGPPGAGAMRMRSAVAPQGMVRPSSVSRASFATGAPPPPAAAGAMHPPGRSMPTPQVAGSGRRWSWLRSQTSGSTRCRARACADANRGGARKKRGRARGQRRILAPRISGRIGSLVRRARAGGSVQKHGPRAAHALGKPHRCKSFDVWCTDSKSGERAPRTGRFARGRKDEGPGSRHGLARIRSTHAARGRQGSGEKRRRRARGIGGRCA